jgi:hypothetical protein
VGSLLERERERDVVSEVGVLWDAQYSTEQEEIWVGGWPSSHKGKRREMDVRGWCW